MKGSRSKRGCRVALDTCERANQRRRGRKRNRCTQSGTTCQCQNARGRCGRCVSDVQAEFAEWKVKYNKTYTDQDAEAAAYANWQVNRDKMRSYHMEPESFEMTLDKFADESLEDFLNSPRLGGRTPGGCLGPKNAAGWQYAQEVADDRRLANVVTNPKPEDAPTPLVTCPKPYGDDSCDWSHDGDSGSFLPPAKDQGQCGSCYVFAAVAALEGALAIVEQKNTGKHAPVSLSEQMILTTPWAATGASAAPPQGPPPGGTSVETSSPCPSAASLGTFKNTDEKGWPWQPCAGGGVDDVLEWLYESHISSGTGVTTSEAFPYAGYPTSSQRPPSTCPCAFACPEEGCPEGGGGAPVCRATASSRGLTTKPATIWNSLDKSAYVRTVRAALKAQPVAAGIYSTNIVNYKGGIIQDKFCKDTTGEHGVTIVGYGECHKKRGRPSDPQCANVKAGTKYWKVRNSWGSDWGLGGYFYVEQGACGLHDHVSGIPDLAGVKAGASS